MLDAGEISESEAVTVIQQQIETIRSQYGNVITSIMIFVVAGLLIQSRRNKKQNQNMVYRKNANITSDNDQENMNKSISDDTNICQDTNTNETITCCIENSATNHNQRERTWSYLVTSGLLIILMGLVLFLWNSYRTPSTNNTVAHTVLKPVTYSVPSGVRFAKIQDVQVGERAIGVNPELTDSERATFLPDPDPVTWRKLTLEMIKSDGKRLDITLLRPLSWIDELQADIGTTIFLDLPELGAQGFAKVLNIESCPPIKPGKGNVVTGTFHHEAANTIDLHVEGLSKPIGCTDNHPFWSVTRNEFIEAGKLQQGEELQLYNGQTTKVIQILPRPGPEPVHNLEVMNEHVYRITSIGLLVHNSYNGNLVTIRNKSLANQKHPVTGVPFDADGFPDFSAHVVNQQTLPTIKGYVDDFAEADRLAGITAEYRQTNKLTWHHHQDCKTMLLIPTEIHQKTGHTGGLAIIKVSQ
jgi:hypothetical protein